VGTVRNRHGAVLVEADMELERAGEGVRLALTQREAHLLKRALERASFIDTPVDEQEEIATFCALALEALAPL
jgi:hypothetical protein